MKSSKKIVALLMTALMLLATSVTALASANVTLTKSESKSFSVVDGVDYAQYSVYGSSSGHTENVHILEFNPEDGYVPMSFAKYAGWTSTLESHYNAAIDKYGYEVVGVINGSFFDMTYGTLDGMLISGGKVCCADPCGTTGNKISVVAFGYDGSMNIVDTNLAYRLYINGENVPDAFRFINKQQEVDGYAPGVEKIYYYDTSCGSYADSIDGYEVICKKLDGTDLRVGETMVGEVVEVKSNTSGSPIGADEFVLSTASGADYETYLKNLSVGDKIEISVEETVSASKQIMESAYSVITNVGWLVKDGVDMTDKNSTIGTHSVSGTYARWTAFGQKADGTYVFFTSEGGDTGVSSRSLTLKDVAAAMMKMGCVNVIRMDGGGSTAMYVSNTGNGSAGYMYESSRGVADCILIVKGNPGKGDLKTALAAAKNVSCDKYSETTLSEIRTAYDNALKVYRDSSSTDADYQSSADALNALLAKNDSASSLVKDPIYINQFNASIAAGDCTIFTSEFNGGKITAASANHIWTQHVLLTWDSEKDAYVVTSNTLGSGASTKDITLASNQILIAAHGNGGISSTNKQRLANVKVGQVLELCGIDVESKEIGLLSYIRFEGEGTSSETPEDTKVGWVYENNGWYYYKNNVKQTGWLYVGNAWYYMNANGKMVTGWVKDGGVWYYMNPNGTMATGWVKSGGVWYYMNPNGTMATGWVKAGGVWYYMNPNGTMATGWIQVNGTWYYMYSNGKMASNTWVDGYYLNASGAWVV